MVASPYYFVAVRFLENVEEAFTQRNNKAPHIYFITRIVLLIAS